jgi:hypothetical protein
MFINTSSIVDFVLNLIQTHKYVEQADVANGV